MQRFALFMILAAVPLLCASMLAQSSDTSADGTVRASLASANYNSAGQCFHGQWYSASDVAQESSCTMSGFLTSVQPTRAVVKQRSTAVRPNAIHGLIASANLQPVYEKLVDAQFVVHSRYDIARLYFLRPAGQPLNPPDHQKVASPSEFAREWKQNAKAAEIHSVAQIESSTNFRVAVAAHARNGMRRLTNFQRDPDSENNCLISEEDAKPAQRYRTIVAGGFAAPGMKVPNAPEKFRASEVETLREIESLPIWSEAPAAAVKGMKVKNGVVVK